jgi:hypothetical protein
MSADQDDIFEGSKSAKAPPSERRLGTVERAFELARTGEFRTIEEIASRLKQERQESVDAHLTGGSIRKDLRQICAETRTLRVGSFRAPGGEPLDR